MLSDTGIQAAAVDKYADVIKPIVGNGNKALNVNVPALEASFDRAFGIAQSSNGDIYFAAPASALNFPVSVTLIEDSNGKVTTMLITDATNYRIREVDMDTGKIKTIAGKNNGQSTDGTPAIQFGFSGPFHAYYDKLSGDIFIVDYHKHQVLRMFASNDTISTVIGKCTVSSGLGDGGLAIDACLKFPSYFTMNKDGNMLCLCTIQQSTDERGEKATAGKESDRVLLGADQSGETLPIVNGSGKPTVMSVDDFVVVQANNRKLLVAARQIQHI